MTGRRIIGALVLIGLLAAVTALTFRVGIWVLCATFSLSIWWASIYVAFSRTTLRTIVRIDEAGQDSRVAVSAWRYPHWRNGALVAVVIIPLLAVIVPVAMLLNDDSATPGAEMQPPATTVVTEQDPAPTLTEQRRTATPGHTPSPTAEQPTATPSPTLPAPTPTVAPPTMTPSFTPTEPAPTPEPATQTPTPTPSPTPAEPSPTATHTRTPTPLPPTETPEPIVVQPEPLVPLEGREYKNPITFQWDGTLYFGQSFLVTVIHTVSGERIQSDLLSTQEWSTNLPAERFGEWRWRVEVLSLGRAVAASPEQVFWFNPLPGTRRPRPTPTPTRAPIGTQTP